MSAHKNGQSNDHPVHPVQPEELQAWLDRELTPERTVEVEGHVKGCSECAAIVEDLKQVSASLLQWEIEPAPGTLRPPYIELPASPPWTWQRKLIAVGSVVGMFLIIASIAIPNLLRSRMSSSQPRNLPMSDLERSRAVKPEDGYVIGFAGPRTDAPAQTTSNKSARMIARTATISLEVDDITSTQQRVQAIVASVGGFMGSQSVNNRGSRVRSGSFTLQVPTTALERVLVELRNLGAVTHEQTHAEEITDQFVDLEARLRNARATERRLINILNQRTAKLTHILEVEREIARKRGEIERMVAQRESLLKRASLASVQVRATEKYAEPTIESPSGVLARMWHALRDGVLSFLGLLNALVLFILRWGLHIALFSLIGWQLWRRWLGPAIREQNRHRL